MGHLLVFVFTFNKCSSVQCSAFQYFDKTKELISVPKYSKTTKGPSVCLIIKENHPRTRRKFLAESLGRKVFCGLEEWWIRWEEKLLHHWMNCKSAWDHEMLPCNYKWSALFACFHTAHTVSNGGTPPSQNIHCCLLFFVSTAMIFRLLVVQ